MTSWFRVNALRTAAVAIAICAASLLLIAGDKLAREALWDIVHTTCVPDEVQKNDPSPCTAVDLNGGVEKGFAVLKDLRGATQFLLIPTAQIAGIESLVLQSPDVPNYFAEAWETRKYINDALHKVLPREDISLAINSAVSRSQDQLHIHVDCVREEVRAALLLHAAEIGSSWTRLSFPLSGHHYMAMWVPGEKLGATNPFKLVADGVPGASQDMGDRTLVVVGATRSDGTVGFILLEDQASKANSDIASGEELQDHACRVAATVGGNSN